MTVPLSSTSSLLFLLVLCSATRCEGAFLPLTRIQCNKHPHLSLLAPQEQDDDDMGLDDVTPPTINLRKESILFGENPETQRSNFFLATWRDAKATLPTIVTGASETRADGDPFARLYNMVFVRGPTIVAGLLYAKNAVTGHPLIVDIGDGPFEVSPLIVLGVLYAILRVP